MNNHIDLIPQANPIATQAIDMIGKTLPQMSSQSLIGITSSICNCIAQCKESVERTRRFEAFVGLQAEAINARCHTADELISHTFGEREKVLTSYQDILAQAVKNNNIDQLVLAINAINGVVAQAPAPTMSQVAQIYNGTLAQQ